MKHSTWTESLFQVPIFRLAALLKIEKILWTRLQSLTSFYVLFEIRNKIDMFSQDSSVNAGDDEHRHEVIRS